MLYTFFLLVYLISMVFACRLPFETEEELMHFRDGCPEIVKRSPFEKWELIPSPDANDDDPQTGEKVLSIPSDGDCLTTLFYVNLKANDVIGVDIYYVKPGWNTWLDFRIALFCDSTGLINPQPRDLNQDLVATMRREHLEFPNSLEKDEKCRVRISMFHTGEANIYLDSINFGKEASNVVCYNEVTTTRTDSTTDVTTTSPGTTTEIDPTISSSTDDGSSTISSDSTPNSESTPSETPSSTSTASDQSTDSTNDSSPSSSENDSTTESESSSEYESSTDDDSTRPPSGGSGNQAGFPLFSHFYMIVIIAVMSTTAIIIFLVTLAIRKWSKSRYKHKELRKMFKKFRKERRL